MGDRYISQFSTAAAELTSGQGHALTMASRQDDLLGKISEMEKSMDKLPEMEKILGQLFDLMKSITQELCLQSPSPAITTTPLPPSTVMECRNPNHEAHDLYQSFPDDWEHASMTVNQGEARSICLLVSSYGDGIYTNAVYEVKFKHGGEVPVIRHVAKFREGYCPRVARVFNHSNLYYFGDDGGFIVDMETWSKCSSIPPTPASNSRETIVYAYDKVYYLARRSSLEPVTEPSFGRYDPNQKVWEQMTPFPFYDDYDRHMRITGYAVCNGVILFSLCGLINGKHFQSGRWVMLISSSPKLPCSPKPTSSKSAADCRYFRTCSASADALQILRPRRALSICCAARRRAVRYDDDGEDEEEEEYGHHKEIAVLELYSQSVRGEALIVHAVVDDQDVQVLIFKGFSSCLSYRTSPDPSKSILPARAVIKSIDRVKGPFDPSNIEYLQKGLTWEAFKSTTLPPNLQMYI